MTEQEWLTSADPQAMLRHFSPTSTVRHHQISDRKLQLWVEACRELGFCQYDLKHVPDADAEHISRCVMDETHRHFATTVVGYLRCVVGNPWRPVTLPRSESAVLCPHCGRVNPTVRFADLRCLGCGQGTAVLQLGRCPWLTPTVIGLAHAAYDERLPDGTLDPVRLAVLADALEEAGCPSEGEVECPECYHHKDDPGNHWPGKLGYRPVRDVASGRHEGGWGNCYRCNSGGKGYFRPGFVRVPNPLLAHLRGPGPHVRGCWAVDLVLGLD